LDRHYDFEIKQALCMTFRQHVFRFACQNVYFTRRYI